MTTMNDLLVSLRWSPVRRQCAVIVLALAVLCINCGSHSSSTGGDSSPPAVTVTIDASHRFQTVESFGAGLALWSAAGGHACTGTDTVTGSDKTKILDLLYSDLGLTSEHLFVSYQSSVDISNFQTLAPEFAQATQRVQANGDQFRYNVGAFVTSALRDLNGRLTSAGAAAYANWAASFLRQLASQLGILVDHWDIAPEPDGVGNLTPSELHQLVGLTGAAFRTAGVTTAIAMPRTVTVADVANYANPILGDPSALQYVNQIDFHEYDYDASQGQSPDIADRHVARDLADQHGLTVAMRETSGDVKQNTTTFWNGTYDQAMAWVNDVMTDIVEANAGAWDLIVADGATNPQFGVGAYIIMNYSNCVYSSFQLPPHYWTIRQFVKFVRPGAARIASSSSSSDVRAAAFVDSKRQETIIVVINNNATSGSNANFTGVPSGLASVTQTTQTQTGVQLPEIASQSGQFTETLPARSVTTFVFGP